MTHPIINNVKHRFLPLCKSVEKKLEPEPKLSDFTKIKDLGCGTFGKVFLASHNITKVKYAIKCIDKNNKINIEGTPYFIREIEIMYKLHHPNCVKLYGHFEDNDNMYFIMEYVPKGNLYNLILRDKSQLLNPQTIASLLKDIISAVYYLHNMNPPIIHRDIKPENALLSEDNVVKLTDFGWSNYLNSNGSQRMTFCGTPIYLAPEMILNKGHDEHVDIWCIGVLLFELLCGTPPFVGKNREELTKNIIKGNISWKNNLDNDAKDLISKILVIEPQKRIGLKEIITHNFFIRYFPNANNILIKPVNYEFQPYIISKDHPGNFYKILKKKKLNKKNNSNYNTNHILNGQNKLFRALTPNQSKFQNKMNVSYDNIKNIDYMTNKYIKEKYQKLKNQYKELFNLYSILQKKENEIIKESEQKDIRIKNLINQQNILLEKINENEKMLELKNSEISYYKNKINEKDKEIAKIQNNNIRPKTPELKYSISSSNYKKLLLKNKSSKKYSDMDDNIQKLTTLKDKFSTISNCSSTLDSFKYNNIEFINDKEKYENKIILLYDEIKKIRENESKRFHNMESKYRKLIEDKDCIIKIYKHKMNEYEKK